MNAPVCPKCNSTTTLIPGGYSERKQKDYPPFWACPTKDPATNKSHWTINDAKWREQQQDDPVQTFNRSLNEEPIKSTEVEEPMKKVDWNFKEFTGGLRALTVDYRREDLSPGKVWEETSTKDWMQALYGGYEGYDQWEKEYEARLVKLKR